MYIPFLSLFICIYFFYMPYIILLLFIISWICYADSMFNIMLNNNIFIFLVGCQIYTCFILMKVKVKNNEKLIDSLIRFMYMVYLKPISMLIFFIIYSFFSLIIRGPIFFCIYKCRYKPLCNFYIYFIFNLAYFNI